MLRRNPVQGPPFGGRPWKSQVPLALILLLFFMMVSCEQEKNEYVAPPPPKVTIAQPLEQKVVDYLQFTGTTRAFEMVEVRARVAGLGRKKMEHSATVGGNREGRQLTNRRPTTAPTLGKACFRLQATTPCRTSSCPSSSSM